MAGSRKPTHRPQRLATTLPADEHNTSSSPLHRCRRLLARALPALAAGLVGCLIGFVMSRCALALAKDADGFAYGHVPSAAPLPFAAPLPLPPLPTPPMPPAPPPAAVPEHLVPSAWATATPASLSLARLDEFCDRLTAVVAYSADGLGVRAVRSSGGAAGGVVSEGQGYGLFLAASVAAALNSSHARRQDVVELAYELFLGWKQMCERTTHKSCQSGALCAGGLHECLPSWKFDDNLAAEVSTGSTPDGDEDAIMGMVLLVLATEGDSARASWWSALGQWAYDSCRAFLAHLTVAHTSLVAQNGQPLRALKLGSCWGGWDCNNPSYHAPAHYMAFRNFMAKYDDVWGTGASEGDDMSAEWDALIETSFAMVGDSQCEATGLVPNWFVPTRGGAEGAGTAGCSGSGTPAAEFGSEAARTGWRLALGWLWFGDAQSAALARRMGSHAASVLSLYGLGTCYSIADCASLQLSTGCLVTSIHDDWLYNAFMLGPVVATLTVPTMAARWLQGDSGGGAQQAALDNAATLLGGMAISGYYSGSWVALATLTLSGDLSAAAPLLASMRTPAVSLEIEPDRTVQRRPPSPPPPAPSVPSLKPAVA
eukprot:4280884-Prymnesium_polylepis.1